MGILEVRHWRELGGSDEIVAELGPGLAPLRRLRQLLGSASTLLLQSGFEGARHLLVVQVLHLGHDHAAVRLGHFHHMLVRADLGHSHRLGYLGALSFQSHLN